MNLVVTDSAGGATVGLLSFDMIR